LQEKLLGAYPDSSSYALAAENVSLAALVDSLRVESDDRARLLIKARTVIEQYAAEAAAMTARAIDSAAAARREEKEHWSQLVRSMEDEWRARMAKLEVSNAALDSRATEAERERDALRNALSEQSELTSVHMADLRSRDGEISALQEQMRAKLRAVGDLEQTIARLRLAYDEEARARQARA
jgi:chromosome segregation ATPase